MLEPVDSSQAELLKQLSPDPESPYDVTSEQARGAAVYLASKAKKVWMLVRREGLEATMSKYLIDRIKAQANIELLRRGRIQAWQIEVVDRAVCR